MKSEKTQGKLTKLLAAIFIVVFFARVVAIIDPDFGYRFINGGYILQNGVPKIDLYSYTMPSFPYVEHAWLVAVGFYLINKFLGYYALSAVVTMFALGALVITVNRNKPKGNTLHIVSGNLMSSKRLWYVYYFPFLLAVAAIFPFVGVRAQVFSWFTFSVFLYFLFSKDLWKKWRVLTPLLFILWSNLHGSFSLGIAFLFVVLVVKAIRIRKLEAINFLVLFFSVSATLINPYGFGVWREVWLTITDSYLRTQVAEWQTTLLLADFSAWIFISFSFAAILKYRRKFKLEELAIFLVVFSQTILSKRQVPIFLIVALPMTIVAIESFYNEVKSIKFAKERFYKLLRVFWIITIALLTFQFGFGIKSTISFMRDYYPKDAVYFLNDNLPKGEIFSVYGWGGYLIWKLPEKRVFIDGRMPSWRYDRAPEGESSYAFKDYVEIINGDLDYKPVFEKYGIDTVLWSTPEESAKQDKLTSKLFKIFGKEESDFNFTETLKEDGWVKVYENDTSLIYKHPERQ